MIRQPAFVNVKKHLKGGLHCHTTRSDGRGDPADVIRLHAENGYDFMTLTDHWIYNYKNFAPDVKITIIPGMETDRDLPGPGIHCHHIVSIGPEKDQGNGFEQDQQVDTALIERPEQTQELLDMLHANGNMTIFCHPQWSGVTAREFEMLEGNFAMEVWNSGCALSHGVDTNAAYWDELLIQGKRIWGVASDDGHAMQHHCRGWVMVNSENNVSAILKALKDGAFYASCGPEIYDFYVENGEAFLNCSPVKEIEFRYLRYPYGRHCSVDGQDSLTGIREKVCVGTSYIRAVVIDAQGHRAWTNPIFLDGET